MSRGKKFLIRKKKTLFFYYFLTFNREELRLSRSLSLSTSTTSTKSNARQARRSKKKKTNHLRSQYPRVALLAQLSWSINSRSPTTALALPPAPGTFLTEVELDCPAFQVLPYCHAHLSAFSLPEPSNQAERPGSVAASVISWTMMEACFGFFFSKMTTVSFSFFSLSLSSSSSAPLVPSFVSFSLFDHFSYSRFSSLSASVFHRPKEKERKKTTTPRKEKTQNSLPHHPVRLEVGVGGRGALRGAPGRAARRRADEAVAEGPALGVVLFLLLVGDERNG